MTPSEYNFPAQRRGDTFNGHGFKISVNGVLVDFTSATTNLQLRRFPGAPIIMEWKSSDGSITYDIPNGTIMLSTKTGLEMNLDAYNYLYDLQVLLGNGVTNTYLFGVMPISNDITRTP